MVSRIYLWVSVFLYWHTVTNCICISVVKCFYDVSIVVCLCLTSKDPRQSVTWGEWRWFPHRHTMVHLAKHPILLAAEPQRLPKNVACLGCLQREKFYLFFQPTSQLFMTPSLMPPWNGCDSFKSIFSEVITRSDVGCHCSAFSHPFSMTGCSSNLFTSV